jgi:DNA mismatch endonuclease, patch repair protein
MADLHSTEQRSRNMAAVRGTNTKPELRVRSLLHRMGLRFRLYAKDLPGKPDIVLRSRRVAIFVHGCFWHSHTCKHGRQIPATRAEFWHAKRDSTVHRDARNLERLQSLGWRALVIWECQTKSDDAQLMSIIDEALGRTL